MLDITNPRQTIIVTLRHGKDSMFASDWHSPCSSQPFHYLVILHNDSFALDMITKSHVFCVNFIPSDFGEKVLDIASSSTELSDKFSDSGLKKEECETIDCPRLKDALAYIECSIKEIIKSGDSWILVGEASRSEVLKPGKRLFHTSKGVFTTTK